MSVGMAEVANTNGIVDVSASGGASTGPAAVTTTKYGDPLVYRRVPHHGDSRRDVAFRDLCIPTADYRSFHRQYAHDSAGTYTPSLSISGSNGASFTIAMGPVPVTSPGVVGNFYINTSTGALWGPKSSSGWNPWGTTVIPESSPPSTIRGLTFTFDGGGSALSAGKVVYLRVALRLHDCELEHRQYDGGNRYGRPLARGNRWHSSPHLQQLHQHGRRVTYLGHGHLLNDFDGFHLYRNRRERLACRIAYGSHREPFVSYTLGCQQ